MFADVDVSSFEGVVEGVTSLEPLVLSLLILGVAALVLGAWWLVRWFRRPPGARLRRVLAGYDDVSVLMHPNPDPDAMACAMGVATIADSVDTNATLQYPGEIRHQENRAFRTVLGLDLESVESSSISPPTRSCSSITTHGVHRRTDRRADRRGRSPSRKRDRDEVHRRPDGVRCGVDDRHRVRPRTRCNHGGRGER